MTTSYSRDSQEYGSDEKCDGGVPSCGLVHPAAHHERARSGLPRAGSFSNLDEVEEEAPLSFPRDANISNKIEEVGICVRYSLIQTLIQIQNLPR
jgi:hypothetical protein